MTNEDKCDSLKLEPVQTEPNRIMKAETEKRHKEYVEMFVRNLNENVKKGTITS